MKPYCEADGVTIYHGDALEVLDELGTPVDAVLTDPPYASGTRKEAGKPGSGAMLRGGRFADHPIDLDQMTTTGFIWLMRQTALRCYPLMPDGASFLSFIDWRMFATLQGALETCNYRAQTQIVWNKGSIGMGNGFRNQHELVIHASKGVPTVYDRGIGNVLTYTTGARGGRQHERPRRHPHRRLRGARPQPPLHPPRRSPRTLPHGHGPRRRLVGDQDDPPVGWCRMTYQLIRGDALSLPLECTR